MSNAMLNCICNDENDLMLPVKLRCKHGDLLSMQTSWSEHNPARRFWSCPRYRACFLILLWRSFVYMMRATSSDGGIVKMLIYDLSSLTKNVKDGSCSRRVAAVADLVWITFSALILSRLLLGNNTMRTRNALELPGFATTTPTNNVHRSDKGTKEGGGTVQGDGGGTVKRGGTVEEEGTVEGDSGGIVVDWSSN
ncbi:hypothetical protein H5410_013056 [Solanum commersonii]|uniref:Uncharacterized protein n=1 Tax=Solanum commersonii TaxID=4109 RepID=A0A9J6ATF8_SOLCO|nr:hypothetical protein H5410_013056 [Solanum commersonii]